MFNFIVYLFMLTLNDIHAQLDEALGINSIESSFSTQYYTDLVNGSREVALRNEYNKNRVIDPYVIQDLNCVELEVADPIQCCIEVPLGCKLLRTVKEIPNTIEFYRDKAIVHIGSPDITKPRIPLIEYSRISFIGYGRTTYDRVYAFIYMKRVYFISRDTSYLLWRKANFRIIASDPTSLGEFTNCSGQTCWSPNSEYPMNLWMWETLVKPYVVQQLMQKQQFPLDDANDEKDAKV